MFEDRDGVIWVLTTTGIDAFRSQIVSVFSTRQGLPTDGVESILPMSNGDVWLGNTTVSVIRNDRVIVPEHAELFGDKGITSLLEDSDKKLWIGLDRSLQIFDGAALEGMWPGQRWNRNWRCASACSRTVQAISGSARLRLPIGCYGYETNTLSRSSKKPKSATPIVFAADPMAGIWIGYKDGHIASYRQGKWETLPSR